MTSFAIGPAPHRVSRALRAQNPGRVRKESGKSTPGQGPKSAQRVRPGVSKESEKSLKSDFRTLFGLFRDSGAHSLGTFGTLPRGTLSGLFSDSSGVPGPKGPGDPVWGGADRKTFSKFPPVLGQPGGKTDRNANSRATSPEPAVIRQTFPICDQASSEADPGDLCTFIP